MTLLAKGGWFGEAKPGGFRGLASFHMGLCLWEVPAVESLSQKSKIFASSLWQGSRGQCPQPISHGGFLRFVTSLTRPVSLPGGNRTKAPLAKGGCLGLPRRGDKRLASFHMGLCLWEVPAVESLSQKSKIFASSLWQGSRGQCPLTMRTVAFCESLLP